METLSTESCSKWLEGLGIPEDPYHHEQCPAPFCDQVSLPAEPWRKRSVIQHLFSACGPYDTALLQLTDWQLTPDAMAILGGIRTLHGDQRHLIESPGHLFDPAEHDLVVGMFAFGMFYGFSAYLYFSHKATVLGWEGEMLDFWSFDELRLSEAQRVFTEHGLVHFPADA